MKNFITEVEIADENGETTVVEVITQMSPAECEAAERLAAVQGGHMSHDEIVNRVRQV